LETVETPKDFMDVIRTSREPHFIVWEGHIKDFETALSAVYRKPNKLEISKAAVIVYFLNGDFQIHKNYFIM